jgi:protein disulfide-isomerase
MVCWLLKIQKMKIEIWSDVMCPFCYIGKRNFETALARFKDKEEVEIIWKSFQLDPTLPEVAQESQHDYLVKSKGMSPAQVESMLENVTRMAKRAGLDYHLDRSVMVNSFRAHRLIQLAKNEGLGDEAEERLFRAYFTEGLDIADTDTLTRLGKEIGLDEGDIQEALTDNRYAELIRNDIEEAQALGIRGVPFFVFDRKYGVSGAQPPEQFLQTLEKSFSEWKEKQ